MSHHERTDERLRAFAQPGYLDTEKRLELFRHLFGIRLFEEAVVAERLSSDSGIPGPPFDSYGQEAIAVGAAFALQEAGGSVYYAPSHRSGGGRFVLGLTLDDAWLQWMARLDGPSRGRDLNWHFGSRDGRTLRFISHMASLCPMLTGVVDGANYLMALDGNLTDETRAVGVVEFGDGTMAQPIVHSTMNAAAVLNIPVVFLVNNNHHAIATQPHESHPFDTPLQSPAVRGFAYDMPGKEITNGWDVEEVYYTVRYALERARSGYGPSFIVANAFRFEGHNRTQPTNYMEENPVRRIQREYYGYRDPVEFMRFALRGQLSDENYDVLRLTLDKQIVEARERTRKALKPSATTGDLGEPLSDPRCAVSAQLASEHSPLPTTRKLEYGLAINEALRQAMEKDERVRVFGEDVRSGTAQGGTGGVYGVTRRLTETFGIKRCFSTPISEDWIAGYAAGLAYAGCLPVAEIQFMPFADVAWSQINSIIATHYWQTGRNLPLVIRMPCGIIPSSGHYHSQMLEAGLANIPGLKIVFPADPFEAKGLLLSSIFDPDPVIFMEQINAYYNPAFKGFVPQEPYYLPLGEAQVRREGNDVSIITYGALMLQKADEAATMLAEDGISAEVINLRTLVPLDARTILASYAKTGKALIVHEAVRFAGFGAEIAALLAETDGREHCIARLGALETPVPGSPILEDFRLPGADDIFVTAEKLFETQ